MAPRDQEKAIPLCPLMSVGSQVEIVCMQESCAWYLKNYKICSVYMMAHNSMLDVQAKQAKAKQAQSNNGQKLAKPDLYRLFILGEKINGKYCRYRRPMG